MPDVHVQLVQRTYSAWREPRGSKPVFDLQLQDNERIVGISWSWTADYPSRSTVDHHVVAWVECRFPIPETSS